MDAMHADELRVDEPLVRGLLSERFPEWAGLRLERVRSAGTDNTLFRLGDDLVVRLPRIASAVEAAGKEHRWLPALAPRLPLAVPVPVALGEPTDAYPWPWSVYRWIDGDVATADRIADPLEAAAELGRFVSALAGIGTEDGPAPGSHNAYRGEALAMRDAETREAIAAVGDPSHARAVTRAWERALQAPAWDGPSVWVHGDLIATNLLALGGRLTAVIDWGCLGVGDPACDAMAAWSYLAAETRDAFRDALELDDATWARGRGWALSWGLIARPYYERTNPTLADLARRAIEEVIGDPTA